MVNACLWDLECTLYFDTPDLKTAWNNTMYEVFAEGIGTDKGSARDILLSRMSTGRSATSIFKEFGILDDRTEIYKRVDKSKYLKKDPKLGKVFEDLKDYKHAIVSNTTKEHAAYVLDLIGLDENVFDRIFTAEDYTEPKPSIEPFDTAARGLEVGYDECVSIGDKENTDIVPPISLGMRTIMVWNKSQMADYFAPTVYDVPMYVKKLDGLV